VIKRMLAELLSKLVVRAEALASLQLRFVLDRKQGQVETEPLRPAVPTLDGMLILDLVRLRLESCQIEHGVIEVELEATGVPSSSEQLRVFVDQPRRDFAAGERALARLRAELGPDSVVHALLCDGHLPEACFRWQPVAALKTAAVNGEDWELSATVEDAPDDGVARTLALRPLVRRFFRKPVQLSAPARQLRNDGWLIRGPEPGPVTHTAGPFLVNGGWWLREIQREYQFVMTRREELYWVYQDRRRRRWFLHGLVQ
jgi:protein ImuB